VPRLPPDPCRTNTLAPPGRPLDDPALAVLLHRTAVAERLVATCFLKVRDTARLRLRYGVATPPGRLLLLDS
jgi:hypothetical protein